MNKYLIIIPADYVEGHLRDGHIEGIIEANSAEEAEDIATSGSWYNYNLVIDGYSIDDYELDYDDIEIQEIDS